MSDDTGSDGTAWWRDDDQLMAELAAGVDEARGVPDSFRRLGEGAFAWRTIDAELAALTFDSAVAEPAGLRAADPGPRSLTFAVGETTIDLELHADAVRGQLSPAAAGTLVVRTDEGNLRTVDVDDLGWFVITPPPAGRFRLHIRAAGGASVLTEWIADS